MAMRRYTDSTAPALVDPGDVTGSNSIADALDRFDQKVRPAINAMQLSRQAPQIQQEIAAGGDYAPDLGITPLQQARNRVAQQAYLDRTQLDVQREMAALHGKYQGLHPDDGENFGRELDAYATPKLSAIPEQFRAEAEQRYAEARTQAVTRLTESGQQAEFQRNIKDTQAAAEADAEGLMKAARDGDTGAVGRATVSLAARYQTLVDAGVMGPEVANAEAGKLVEGVKAEAVFGDVMRGALDGLSTVHELMNGGAISKGLSLQTRDRLVSKVTAELGRRHAEAARAEAEANQATKADRESMTVAMWRGIWGGDPAKRPTPDMVENAARAGLIDADEAKQMFRTLATEKVARVDIPTLSALEDQIAAGIDVSQSVAQAQAQGLLAPDVAADLRERSAAAQRRSLPDPIAETRRQVKMLYTDSGPLAGLQEGEAARKVDALRFYDEQVRAAPAGTDSETGLPLAQIAAERALAVLRTRKDEEVQKQVVMLPPRGAVIDAKPSGALSGPKKIDRKATAERLLAEFSAGTISQEELDAELAILERWADAGLSVN